MNKQKRNQLFAGLAVGAILLTGSIYGLAQQPNSFVAKWFNLNNDANKTDKSDNQASNANNSNTSVNPKSYNSDEARKANASSKFAANKDESWRLESIFKEPVNKDYKYDQHAERIGRNENGVSSIDGYMQEINMYSTVKANTEYRNATDEVYEKSMNRLEEGINKLQTEYKRLVATGASSFTSDELEKIKIQYFASKFSTMKQFPEAITVAGGLKMDKSTFKERYTSADGVYAFEVMFNSEKTGEQFMYMSGFYNEQVNYFEVKASIYMMDGAVAKDKFLLDKSNAIYNK